MIVRVSKPNLQCLLAGSDLKVLVLVAALGCFHIMNGICAAGILYVAHLVAYAPDAWNKVLTSS